MNWVLGSIGRLLSPQQDPPLYLEINKLLTELNNIKRGLPSSLVLSDEEKSLILELRKTKLHQLVAK